MKIECVEEVWGGNLAKIEITAVNNNTGLFSYKYRKAEVKMYCSYLLWKPIREMTLASPQINETVLMYVNEQWKTRPVPHCRSYLKRKVSTGVGCGMFTEPDSRQGVQEVGRQTVDPHSHNRRHTRILHQYLFYVG